MIVIEDSEEVWDEDVFPPFTAAQPERQERAQSSARQVTDGWEKLLLIKRTTSLSLARIVQVSSLE
jgi:hypothetical protein